MSADLWAGACITGLGVVGLVAALDIFVPTGSADILGPRTFPITISALLVILGATLSIRALLRSEPVLPDIGRASTLLVMSAALAGYLVLFGLLGFLLSTVVFLAGLFFYLGERKIWIGLLAAVVLAVAIDAAFSIGLNVALPRGLLGF